MREGDWITPTLRLRRPLGEGGMGKVWIAEHAGLHTDVVVKFLADDLATDPEAVARFQREAAAAAQLRSPHVAQPLDYGLTPTGVPYLAMELLEGEDLRLYLQRHGTIDVRAIVTIASHIAKALDRAHERGVVHRDVKPENVFITDVGGEIFAKVLDFGIAKSSHGAGERLRTQTGAVFGTPHYMSPEQVLGSRDVDSRTDLWALGVVVYECFTGRRPFEGESMGALAVAICHAPIPVPSAFDPLLRPIDAWFSRACAREPEQRFATAREMVVSLADAAQAVKGTLRRGEVPHAASSTASIRTTLRANTRDVQRLARARPHVVALGVVGAVVVGGTLGVIAYTAGDVARDKRDPGGSSEPAASIVRPAPDPIAAASSANEVPSSLAAPSPSSGGVASSVAPSAKTGSTPRKTPPVASTPTTPAASAATKAHPPNDPNIY